MSSLFDFTYKISHSSLEIQKYEMKNNFQNINKNNEISIKQKLNNQIIQKDLQQKLSFDDLDGIEPTLPLDWLKPKVKVLILRAFIK